MSNVCRSQNLSMKLISVANLSVLEDIQEYFEVFSRPSLNDEIILDCTVLDGNEEATAKLLEILGIKSNHELAQELPCSGFVVFHA